MVKPSTMTTPSEQSQKFLDAARDLACDEDEAHFDASLRKIAKHKPLPDEGVTKKPEKPKVAPKGA